MMEVGVYEEEKKVVWVFPSKDVTRCPVRLVDKYLSLVPPVKANSTKCNFYLRSLEKQILHSGMVHR